MKDKKEGKRKKEKRERNRRTKIKLFSNLFIFSVSDFFVFYLIKPPRECLSDLMSAHNVKLKTLLDSANIGE